MIAYDRLPVARRNRAFAEIDMLDTMGVFDVEAEQMIVKPDYIIGLPDPPIPPKQQQRCPH